ncbi:MAG: TMEM165/GDT1 family protein [Rhodospirillaceae bacterium]
MEAFFVSAGMVTIGEIGDKTQLLALILAARFKRPLPIVLGILVATLANHTLAGLLGEWIRQAVSPEALRWGLGASFMAVALWALKPDEMEEDIKPVGQAGVFLITVMTFFLAEIGDKTQLATVMLAAKFPSLVAVVAGTTAGMMIADVPAVFFGKMASDRIPFKAVRIVTALLFAGLGTATLLGVDFL